MYAHHIHRTSHQARTDTDGANVVQVRCACADADAASGAIKIKQVAARTQKEESSAKRNIKREVSRVTAYFKRQAARQCQSTDCHLLPSSPMSPFGLRFRSRR